MLCSKPCVIFKNTTRAATLITALSLTYFPTSIFANGHNNNGNLTIYFTRHAEKETITNDVTELAGMPYLYMINAEQEPMIDDESQQSPIGKRLDQVCGPTKCGEQLSDKGSLRAMLLAEWFTRRGVTQRLDAVYATHKIRTQQTVLPTAIVAQLDVTQIPALTEDGSVATELNPESTTPSECPTIQAIFDAQNDGLDTILVAGHSGTLYDIMGDGNENCPVGLGLDTSDENRFPIDANGKVRDFGDVWKVVLRRNGTARFVFRVNLQPSKLSTSNMAR